MVSLRYKLALRVHEMDKECVIAVERVFGLPIQSETNGVARVKSRRCIGIADQCQVIFPAGVYRNGVRWRSDRKRNLKWTEQHPIRVLILSYDIQAVTARG